MRFLFLRRGINNLTDFSCRASACAGRATYLKSSPQSRGHRQSCGPLHERNYKFIHRPIRSRIITCCRTRAVIISSAEGRPRISASGIDHDSPSVRYARHFPGIFHSTAGHLRFIAKSGVSMYRAPLHYSPLFRVSLFALQSTRNSPKPVSFFNSCVDSSPSIYRLSIAATPRPSCTNRECNSESRIPLASIVTDGSKR